MTGTWQISKGSVVVMVVDVMVVVQMGLGIRQTWLPNFATV